MSASLFWVSSCVWNEGLDHTILIQLKISEYLLRARFFNLDNLNIIASTSQGGFEA